MVVDAAVLAAIASPRRREILRLLWHGEQPAGAIGLPRRLYRPTAYGLRVLKAWEAAARTFKLKPRHAQ